MWTSKYEENRNIKINLQYNIKQIHKSEYILLF